MRLTIDRAEGGRWCARLEDGAAARVLALADGAELWAFLDAILPERQVQGPVAAPRVPAAEAPPAIAKPVVRRVCTDRRAGEGPVARAARLAEHIAEQGGRERWVRMTCRMAVEALRCTVRTAIRAADDAVATGQLLHHQVQGRHENAGAWYCIPPAHGGTAGPWKDVELATPRQVEVSNKAEAPASPVSEPEPAKKLPAKTELAAKPASKVSPRPKARPMEEKKPAIETPEGVRVLSTKDVVERLTRKAAPVSPLKPAERDALLKRSVLKPMLDRPAGVDAVRAAIAASQFNGQGSAFRLTLKALGQQAGVPVERLPTVLAWLARTGAIEHEAPARGQVLHRFRLAMEVVP